MRRLTEIIRNCAECLLCNVELTSYTVHDYKVCNCGKLAVDGGRFYLKRSFTNKSDYIEKSVNSDAPFEVIRKNLFRGSPGKRSDSPIVWNLLCDLSDEHLENLIKYNEQHEMTHTSDHQFYIKEIEYRLSKNT